MVACSPWKFWLPICFLVEEVNSFCSWRWSNATDRAIYTKMMMNAILTGRYFLPIGTLWSLLRLYVKAAICFAAFLCFQSIIAVAAKRTDNEDSERYGQFVYCQVLLEDFCQQFSRSYPDFHRMPRLCLRIPYKNDNNIFHRSCVTLAVMSNGSVAWPSFPSVE